VAADHVVTVRRYDAVWAEHDAARRSDTLSEIWADDGFYVDPDVPEGVVGAQALSDFIAKSFGDMPGLAITATTELATLGDRAWYRWKATTRDGDNFEGTDFIEFAADGRIQRLTGFYDD